MYFPVTRFKFYLPISQETICKLDSVESRTKRVKWCDSEEDKEASEAVDLLTSTENVSSVSDIMIRVISISWFIDILQYVSKMNIISQYEDRNTCNIIDNVHVSSEFSY